MDVFFLERIAIDSHYSFSSEVGPVVVGGVSQVKQFFDYLIERDPLFNVAYLWNPLLVNLAGKYLQLVS